MYSGSIIHLLQTWVVSNHNPANMNSKGTQNFDVNSLYLYMYVGVAVYVQCEQGGCDNYHVR